MLSKRLKMLRDSLKLNQAQFADMLGIKQGSYSDIEREKSSLSSTILLLMKYRFSINPDWLLTGEGDMFINKNVETDTPGEVETIDPDEWRKKKNLEFMSKIKEINAAPRNVTYYDNELTSIPFSADFFDLPVSGDISAGYPIPIHSDDELRVIPVSRKLLSDPSGYYCFRVNGESMQPEIFHNDYVVISKEFVPEELSGRIVAVRNDEGITLKRMIIDFTNHISLLVPVNTAFSPILLDESHTIIGVIKLILRLYD